MNSVTDSVLGCTHWHSRELRSWNPGPYVSGILAAADGHGESRCVHDTVSLASDWPSSREFMEALDSLGANKADPGGGGRRLAEKMAEANQRFVRDFNCSFLSPRPSPGLESGMYQLISPRASIWYIYIYCLCLVSFTKIYIFETNYGNYQFKFASFWV